ncbi:DUF1768-domain-containing protein [Amylostereum chailletii]|nr:DUF1768-domain-containing protein [Amylostereum chailletii]
MPPSGPPLRFTGYGTYNVLLHTSDHKVLYEGELYPTAMHLFEAMKFMHNRPDIADEIRCTPSPYDALEVSKRHDDRVRPDWDQVALSIMDEAMYHKFRQHEDARTVLLATGNAPLEFGDTDDGFWGIGRDERGRNEMGQSLVRVRDKLRQELGMM